MELPNGHVTDYITYGRIPHASMIIPVREDGKVLLQKEYSYPPKQALFQFPGGALHKGETPLAGAHRELAEEANLAGKLRCLGWFYTDNRRHAHRLYTYVATSLQPAVGQKDIEEVFEDHWFTVDEIETMIRRGDIKIYSALAAWGMFAQTATYKRLRT